MRSAALRAVVAGATLATVLALVAIAGQEQLHQVVLEEPEPCPKQLLAVRHAVSSACPSGAVETQIQHGVLSDKNVGKQVLASSSGGGHLAVAKALVAGLEKTKDNKYFSQCGGFQHIRWGDGSCAQAFVDTSSFITLLLFHADHWKAEDLSTATGSDSVDPSAAQYYDAAEAEKGKFSKVKCITHVKAGDWIFLKYPKGGDSSGHAMLVEDAPVRVKDQKLAPTVPKTIQYSVRVIDSVNKPHGPTDSRAKKPGKYGAVGVGSGDVRVYALADTGEVVAFAWSTEKTAKLLDAKTNPIVVARTS